MLKVRRLHYTSDKDRFVANPDELKIEAVGVIVYCFEATRLSESGSAANLGIVISQSKPQSDDDC